MLASQTKLLTSIAALKVVEQSLIGLDEDVCPHLPELAAHKIIQGFDEDDKPKLVERKGPITIRYRRSILCSPYSPMLTLRQKDTF